MNASSSMLLGFQLTVSAGAVLLALLLTAASHVEGADRANTAPPSVVKGQPAGVNVGDCVPDFQLEPVALSADFKRWLGDKAPRTFDDKVMLSDFIGKAPIVLLFGSFT